MIRRNFLRQVSFLTGAGFADLKGITSVAKSKNDRDLWLETLLRVVSPVLTALSENQLKQRMPVEAQPSAVTDRKKVTYLEALGRTLAGVAPWLELSEGSSSEMDLRKKYVALSIASIKNAVTPGSTDYMNFTEGAQPLVDAAFLAHGLLRAPKALWGNLDATTRDHVFTALRSTRVIKPYNSNWLLFAAIVEAALLKFSGECEMSKIEYGIEQHQLWYKGDGVYGDGPDLHFDYYNSYVIHPMLLDVTKTVAEETGKMADLSALFIKRAKRYAEIQERLISPEGTFPPVGRSIAYRCGAFQLLAQMALQKQLPESLKPAQVRSALTAVIKRTLHAPQTFDDKGWLTIGLAGHQPGVGESYISTGSLYLCTTAFLPLGLGLEDDFWKGEGEDWTSRKAFFGKEFRIDKAL